MTRTHSLSNVSVPYANKMWCWMRERREYVSFSAAAIRRVQYGQAIDLTGSGAAGLTYNGRPVASNDWTPFVQTITLTSSDGSHADFNAATLADDGVLSSAGVHYDHADACLWIQANNAGGQLYKVTGLSGALWSVQKVAGTAARYGTFRGTYGRFRVATIGGVKLAMRVTSTTDPIQVMRLG